MMTSVPVVFAFDDRVLRPASVAIMSLIDAALPGTEYLIHVLHPGFKKKVIRGLSDLIDPTRHRISFHRVDPAQFEGLPSGRGSWTEIVYYRFAAENLLPQYERAIYSDIDVFFADDISSLMTLNMDGCPIGAVIGEVNGPAMECHTYFEELAAPYVFMSGFLLMDFKRMRQEQVCERILQAARSYAGRLRMYDLEALNLGCDRIFPLPFEYCVLESIYAATDVEQAAEYSWLVRAHGRDSLERAKARPAIIHYAGRLGKPWRRPECPDYYRKLLDRVPAVLDRKTVRDIRKFWTAWLVSAVRGVAK